MNFFMLCPACRLLYHAPTLEPERGGRWYCSGHARELVLLDQDLHDLCEATYRVGGVNAVLQLWESLR